MGTSKRADGLLTTAEVAAELGVSRERVRQLVVDGHLPEAEPRAHVHSTRLFDPDAVAQLLGERRRELRRGHPPRDFPPPVR